MKKVSILIFTLLFSLGIETASFSWEPYDRVVAVVNSVAIVESEVLNKFLQLKKQKNIPLHKSVFEKSRILDMFIERALIIETANEESIIVNDVRVISQLEKMMQGYFREKYKTKNEADYKAFIVEMGKRLERRMRGIMPVKKERKDELLDQFIGYIEVKNKTTFKDFFEDMRDYLTRELVISIAIGVSPPKKVEALKWYNANKSKLGFEIWAKHILIIPKSSSFKDERDAAKTIGNLRTMIINGSSFESVAMKYSEDYATRNVGGDLGWIVLAETDPYLAGNLYQLYKPGQISNVFKTARGYQIVKYIGRRPVTFEKVEDLIMRKLYNENMVEQFKTWVVRRKKSSEIKIYMKEYVATK